MYLQGSHLHSRRQIQLDNRPDNQVLNRLGNHQDSRQVSQLVSRPDSQLFSRRINPAADHRGNLLNSLLVDLLNSRRPDQQCNLVVNHRVNHLAAHHPCRPKLYSTLFE
jgi:hypothetical protein